MSSRVTQIHNKTEHDQLVAQSKTTPTVIHISNSALPVCEDFGPKYAHVAEKYNGKGIAFAEMDFTLETSYLSKFAPSRLPVTVLIVREGLNTAWAKTVMGPNTRELETSVETLLKDAANG